MGKNVENRALRKIAMSKSVDDKKNPDPLFFLFKYYVIKEVGGWSQKIVILDDLQYCKSSKSWVVGPKKVKNMMM